jgi:6-phosphogluconolactonase
MSTSVIVSEDRDHIALRALDLMTAGLREAVQRRGEAHLALTGGSSASALYAALRTETRARRVPWAEVHVWQGDERFVPVSHADSNWAPAVAEWLTHDGGPDIPDAHLHPVPVDAVLADGGDVEAAAGRYSADIERLLPRRNGVPAFDVVLLGVGGDGHILSVFPGSTALGETQTAAVAIPAPTHIGPHQPRVTLVPRLLEAAGLILPMVPGFAKRDIVAEIFGPTKDPTRWPAQLALRPNAVWLLDQECAAGLR